MRLLLRRASRALLAFAAIGTFLLALDAIKTSARALVPVLDGLSVRGKAGALGMGWLLACAFLSGSPSAAVALGLLGGGALDPSEALAMITGSRIGASFVVLALGILHDRRGRRQGSVYVGAATLLATATIYLPAAALALAARRRGFFDGVSVSEVPVLSSVLDATIHPVVAIAGRALPAPLLLLLGVASLLLSFHLLDRALPAPSTGRLAGIADRVWRPAVVFAIGMIVTAATLSVSLSISLLVPLTARGYIRRENLLPYILGANITTFLDTLLASLLVGHPAAFPVVASLVTFVAAATLLVLVFFYRPYAGWVDRTAHAWTSTRRRQAFLLAGLLGVPILLLALGGSPA